MTSKPKKLRGHAQDFHLHRDHTRAHLIGKQDTDNSLLPSFFPPASFWTSSEKDLFFHGLSVFSRLRPDLIAEHIKTKSTLDVCVYLDALHTASLRQCPDVPPRMLVEPAMDVSERWVECEELLARKLATSAGCTWSFDRTCVDNTHNRASCSCPSDSIGSKLPTGFEAEANGYLNHLDPACLTVMESFMRIGAPEDADSSHLPSNEFVAGTSSNGSALGDCITGTSSESEDDDDQPMKPQTLQLSKDVESELYRQTLLRRRIRKRLHMRRKRAEQTGRTIIMENIKLRPGRPKKRRDPSIYRQKKHKRGIAGGGYRDRPGNEVFLESEGLKTFSQSSSMSSDGFEDPRKERRSLGGATKPYRVKEFFQESNMDGQTFSGMNLDFFRLSTLGRLLRLFNSLDESPRNFVDDVSISTQTIQFMISITKEFVSELIRHIIITKEQELRLKRSLRVWKYDRDEINHENVAECLASMGLSNTSKEQYLTKLIEKTKLRSSHRSYTDDHIAGNQHSYSFIDATKPAGFILPQSLQWCSLPHYQQLFPDDELLSESIDQEELKNELMEEDILNKEDESRSREFEDSLWEKDGDGTQGI